jgi:hypothetical protein
MQCIVATKKNEKKLLMLNLNEWWIMKYGFRKKIGNLHKDSKIFSITWAVKKEVNGQFWGCITVRGFLQED